MSEGCFISGIQQIGVGVADVSAAFRWCRAAFGTDIRIFEDEGTASLMLRYTGGSPRCRHAILAASLQGGGGLELWQPTESSPRSAGFEVQPGDLGIYCPRIKARRIPEAHSHVAGLALAARIGPQVRTPAGEPTFFLQDAWGLPWQVVEADGWFSRGRHPTGGVAGCMIGVSDIDRCLPLYRGVLGYDRTLSDTSGPAPDWEWLPGGCSGRFRRVLLGHAAQRPGAFSRLLGPTRIELVQCLDRTPRRIFEGRSWGDLGFIHLCFDVHGMDELGECCRGAGFPLTVDSASAFPMGESSGRFAYLEDPDGTLIELVETSRLAISRRRGWYLDLRRRDARRPLPRPWLRLLALGRVRP